MTDIPSLFLNILNQSGSLDMANAEFKKMMGADEALHREYREWCHEVGSSERNGFLDYCEEYLSDREAAWDTLSDYDDEE